MSIKPTFKSYETFTSFGAAAPYPRQAFCKRLGRKLSLLASLDFFERRDFFDKLRRIENYPPFCILSERYHSMVDIIIGALALGLLWGIFTLGVHLTYRILDVADLSVEGTLTTGGVTAATLIVSGVNPWLATLAGLALGLVGGLITGLLHTQLKIPMLLSGILTMTALYSINLRINGSANTPLPNQGSKKVETVFTPVMDFFKNIVGEYDKNDSMAWLYDIITSKNFSAVIVGILVVIVVSAIMYWFFGTELGSAIRATGNNQQMVRAQGINTSVMIIICVMLSNGLVGLSGALIAQYQAFADIQMGIGSIVIGLASLIIGEVLIGTKTFRRTLISLAVGAIIYRIIIALVMKLGLAANDLKLFTAITVAFCLALPLIKNKLLALTGKSDKPAANTNINEKEEG